MTALGAASIRRRFVLLTALRWLPTGLLIPITVLFALSRGLTLAQFGAVAAVQGVVVLALELPTGGLADALGGRPTLLFAGAVSLLSLVVMFGAHSVAAFVVVSALKGIYRALDSGPLEAWYVDQTLAVEPDARIERGLSGGSIALSLAIGAGALLSSGLVAWHPFPSLDPLAVPVLGAIALTAVYLVAVFVLLTEVRPMRGSRAALASVRTVPAAMLGGIRLLGTSRVLLALIAVELFWGFGMVAFESLTPVRMAEIAGGDNKAATLMGPVSSAAWAVCAVGAALAVPVSKRIGVATTAALMRVLQGGAVVVMGLVAGPVGLITAFLACYTVHGASDPVHSTLLHRQVDGPNRTLVLSMNSMVSQPAGSLGSLILGGLAGGVSVSMAMIVGGLVLAAAAPLYLPAWRQEQRAKRAINGPADAPSRKPRATRQQ